MSETIGVNIYKAIINRKWLEIDYGEEGNSQTRFWFGITNIDEDRLYGEIFNAYKSLQCIENPKPIYRKKIRRASIIEGSFFDCPEALIKIIEANSEKWLWVDIDQFDNNILKYLGDCHKYDNDPFLDEEEVINDISYDRLANVVKYQLDENQFRVLLTKIYKMNEEDAEKFGRYYELGMNLYSIDIKGKKYVVAYRRLAVDFKSRTLEIATKTTINKSFLIEGKRHTLSAYLTMDAKEFCDTFDEKAVEYAQMIEENFDSGEKENLRPFIFLQRRDVITGVNEALEAIYQMASKKNLTQPLKAFFGSISARGGTSKEPRIVLYDSKKVNIDQMRVVYNTMINHVTYVQGPPGTGKTETIFNVLLSAYTNGKTCLICSNNNIPIKNIFEKMMKSYRRKRIYDATDETEIVFPIIRIGNFEENQKAIVRMRDIIAYVDLTMKKIVNVKRTEKSKETALSAYDNLRQMLHDYETRQEITTTLVMLQQWRAMNNVSDFLNEIDHQIAEQEKRLSEIPEVDNEAIIKNAVSSQQSQEFLNYLYFSSIDTLRKLNSPTYSELKEIIETEDIAEAARLLVKHLSSDINVKRFLDIFPIVVTTNHSAAKLGTASQHFDICIIDEAGQSNVASSLVPIVRARDLLLVGDTNQLQPVTVLESHLNDRFMKQYKVASAYDYIHNSILSTMQAKDENSKRIFLSYHYRCAQKIARFANERFYDRSLNLQNIEAGTLEYHNVKNKAHPQMRNAYDAEAFAIARIVKERKYKDVGILTPFVNQARLINLYLDREGVKDVHAGTIHTLQGSERDTIILSSAISLKTSQRTMQWVQNNRELINVGVTRAKSTLIFVGDKEAIDILGKSQDTDLNVLSDYVAQNGNMIITPNQKTITLGYSNDSSSEKEFFTTIAPYFANKANKYDIQRNVSAKDVLKNVTEVALANVGKKEFDFVIRTRTPTSNYIPIIVFEVDGGEHIGSARSASNDRAKEELCRKHGIKMIRIPNSKVKNYELIIQLFQKYTGQEKPVSIFDYDIQEDYDRQLEINLK